MAHWNRSGSFSNKGAEDRFPEVSCSKGKALAETLVPYEDLTASKLRFINSFEKGFFSRKKCIEGSSPMKVVHNTCGKGLGEGSC